MVPGAFTGGTNHFAHSGRPADQARVAEYESGPYKNFGEEVMKGFAAIVPEDADVAAVGEAVVKIGDAPFGKRPFRVHVDPTQDGAEVVNGVLDRVRAEMLHRVGLDRPVDACQGWLTNRRTRLGWSMKGSLLPPAIYVRHPTQVECRSLIRVPLLNIGGACI